MKKISELSANPWGDDGYPKMLIRLEGMLPLGDGLFEIEGVVPRNIDWAVVASALNLGPETPESLRLMDDISELVWDYDIRNILRDRVKRA